MNRNQEFCVRKKEVQIQNDLRKNSNTEPEWETSIFTHDLKNTSLQLCPLKSSGNKDVPVAVSIPRAIFDFLRTISLWKESWLREEMAESRSEISKVQSELESKGSQKTGLAKMTPETV